MKDEFTCKACGHNFNRLVASSDSDIRCPRCGCEDLEHSKYLFGSPNAQDLTFEDYCDVALAPCCTADWKGWRSFFYSTNCWQPSTCPSSTETSDEEKEKQPEK